MSLLRNLHLPPPPAYGENKADARAPQVGQRVPSVSRGQVGPQRSPHSVRGRGGGRQPAGQRASACLPEQMEALGDRPPGPSPSRSPGHINIYLGKAKVDWGGPSGFSLAVKGEPYQGFSNARLTGRQDLEAEVGERRGDDLREGSDHQLGPAHLVSVSPLKDPSWLGRTRGSNLTHLCPPHSPQRHPGQAGLPEEASGNTD